MKTLCSHFDNLHSHDLENLGALHETHPLGFFNTRRPEIEKLLTLHYHRPRLASRHQPATQALPLVRAGEAIGCCLRSHTFWY
jgi:hypothetical protein